MKQSILLALLITLAATLWLLSGLWVSAESPAKIDKETTAVPRITVAVEEISAVEVMREIIVQGVLEPRRRVEIQAETGGLIRELPIEKGSRVSRGAVIAVLAENDRRAQIARNDAEVLSLQLDLDGMRKLKQKGLQAETQLKAKEAQLAAALADRKRLRLDLDRTTVRAPFDGVLENRPVEIGTLLETGDIVGEVVDQSVVKAVGFVPQQSKADISLGQVAAIRLLDGRRATGRLSYIAPVAEAGTRSFRVEAEIANDAGVFSAGVSAEIRIEVGMQSAHFVSAAVLALDQAGRVGVKALDRDDRVEFFPIEVIRTNNAGVWVTGLPPRLRIVTRGQGFVAAGEVVNPAEG